MNSDLQSLRDRALNRTVAAKLRLQLCLDDEAAAAIRDLEQEVEALEQRRQTKLEEIKDGGSDARLASNPVSDIDARLKKARKNLDDVRAGQAGNMVVLVFGRLKPADYRDLLEQHTDDDKIDFEAFSNALGEKCYRSVESDDGEDLKLSWPEVTGGLLSFGDLDKILVDVVAHNRKAVVLPFSKRS